MSAEKVINALSEHHGDERDGNNVRLTSLRKAMGLSGKGTRKERQEVGGFFLMDLPRMESESSLDCSAAIFYPPEVERRYLPSRIQQDPNPIIRPRQGFKSTGIEIRSKRTWIPLPTRPIKRRTLDKAKPSVGLEVYIQVEARGAELGMGTGH